MEDYVSSIRVVKRDRDVKICWLDSVASNPSNSQIQFFPVFPSQRDKRDRGERWKIRSIVFMRMETTTTRVVVMRGRDRFEYMLTEYTISSTSVTPVLSSKPRNCIPLPLFLSIVSIPCLFPRR